MRVEMVMPKMGESITDGTILKWLKNVGDAVERDEIILEISTDKVDSEIPTPVSGKIVDLVAHEGDTIEVGKTIAIIDTEGNGKEVAGSQEAIHEDSVNEEPVTGQIVAREVQIPKESRPQGARFYSPVVMNIANENKIEFTELEKIAGSGINGRVTKKDILKYINTRGVKPADETIATKRVGPVFTKTSGQEIIAMDHIRKSIAKHICRSRHD